MVGALVVGVIGLPREPAAVSFPCSASYGQAGDLAPSFNTAEAGALAGMIRRGFGRYAAKLASGWAAASPRTLEDTLQERKQLGSWALLRLVRHPGFRNELRAYIDLIEQEEANIALQIELRRTQHARGGDGGLVASGGEARPCNDCTIASQACAACRAVIL